MKAANTAGTVENFAQGYQDYLQAPLQVLRPCVGSTLRVLTDLAAAHGQPAEHNVSDVRTGPGEISQLRGSYLSGAQGSESTWTSVRQAYLTLMNRVLTERTDSTLCVAGAGRGPLVARALKAIERAKADAFVYAVEKNPNAYVT